MQARTLRTWAWLHKWSSLVCTVFMLLLCLTGLPLIFSHEIDHLMGDEIEAPVMPDSAPRASIDAVAAAATQAFPGLVPLYFFAEDDAPDLWYVKLDTRVDTDETASRLILVDARTTEVLGEPEFGEGFMSLMYRLHVDMYAGLPGKWFLGAMGLLLVVSIVSGVVLYGPFMRKLDFATVRCDRSTRLRWLDLHNLLGIVTLAWALVVAATGVVHTLADVVFKAWQADQVAALQAGRHVELPLADSASASVSATAGQQPVQRVVDNALLAQPGMSVSMIAWPGTLRATPEHFAVLLKGDSPLTSKLSRSVLVHPDDGRVYAAGERPWYVTLLQVAEPLHYGDYGGMPMKVFWAVLDLLTIVVLGSGLYLWLKKRALQDAPAGGLS